MKMSMRSCGFALSVCAALVAGGNVASAETFQYSSYSVTNPASIHITAPNNVSGGVGQVVLSGASGTPNAGQSLAVYCMDIFTFLHTSGNYQINPLTTSGTGGSNPSLTTLQINQVGSLIVHGSALISSNISASAATQLAIWMVEYGSSFTFDPNSISTQVKNLALQFVANVTGSGTWAGGSYNVRLLTESHNQSMVFVTPLPSTWTMMIVGLVGLFIFGYRGTRKNTAALAAA